MIGAILTTFAKEIRLLLRRRSAALIYAGVIIGTVLLSLFSWSRDESMLGASMDARVFLARRLFSMLFAVQLVALPLASALLGATVVASERENKTFDLLHCTGMTRVQMLLAKWFSTMALAVVLIIGLLPVLAVVLQFGGIGRDEFIFVGLMLFSSVLTYGMWGVAVSAHMRKTVPAQIITLLLVAFPSALPLLGAVLFEVLNPEIPGLDEFLTDLFRAISPIWCSTDIIAISFNQPGTPGAFRSSWLDAPQFITHLIFQFALWLLALWLAWRGLAYREPTRHAVALKPIEDEAVLEMRRKRFPYYLIDPLKRPQEISDKQNPVLVKESRTGAATRLRTIIRLSYICILISFGMSTLLFTGGKAITAWQAVMVASFFSLLIFLPVIASTGISREREEKTLDLLYVTGLRPWQIVTAKYRIALRFTFILGLSLFVMPIVMHIFTGLLYHYDGVGYAERLDEFLLQAANAVLKVLIPFLSFCILYVAVGVYISSFAKRSVNALIIAYVVMASMAGSVMFFDAVERFIRNSEYNQTVRMNYDRPGQAIQFAQFVFTPAFKRVDRYVPPLISPIAAVIPETRKYYYRDTWPDHFLEPITAYRNVFKHLLCNMVIAYLLLRLAARKLERRQDAE